MLEVFFRDHPAASVSFTVETTANVIRAVERKVATLGLCDGVIPEALSRALFARERHALYCGRGHRRYGIGNLRLDDLRGEPFVSFTADVLGGQHMGPVTAVRAYASFGQWVRAASCNVEEVQRMIRAGIGIGMLPVHLASLLVARGELWQLPPYDGLPVTETFQMVNPSSPLNAAETVFLERCRAVPACRAFLMRSGTERHAASRPAASMSGRRPAMQIGDEASGSAGHGPANVAVADVEQKVAVARGAQDRHRTRGHRAQAGPVNGLAVVHGVAVEARG